MHGYFSLKYYFIKDFDTKNIKKQDKQTVIIFRNYSFKKIDEFDARFYAIERHLKSFD